MKVDNMNEYTKYLITSDGRLLNWKWLYYKKEFPEFFIVIFSYDSLVFYLKRLVTVIRNVRKLKVCT